MHKQAIFSLSYIVVFGCLVGLIWYLDGKSNSGQIVAFILLVIVAAFLNPMVDNLRYMWRRINNKENDRSDG
jgi:hypothetical protein